MPSSAGNDSGIVVAFRATMAGRILLSPVGVAGALGTGALRLS
jgi:hypothetical protein